MSFLKPNLGRRSGDATVPVRHREAVPHAWIPESFARAQGVLAAELEHLEGTFLDALQQADHDLAEARGECAELRRALEEAEGKLRAMRDVLGAG